QRAETAAAHVPGVGDQCTEVGIGLAALFLVDGAGGHHGSRPVEVERTVGVDVDHAGDAGLDQAGRTGLVDLDAGQQAGRDVGQRHRAARGGEDVASVDGGGDVVEAADRDGGHLAAAAIGGLHAGHALQRLDQVVVGELADVLGDDGIDDLHRALLDLQCVDHARAQAAHFDAV